MKIRLSREITGMMGKMFFFFSLHHVKYSYLAKTAHHLLYQRAHGSDVDDFKIINIDGAIHVNVLSNFSEHCHERNISFSSTLQVKDEKQKCP